jgi:hypothetical protein
MNFLKKCRQWIRDFQNRRLVKKRIKELRKRDPFIY